MATSFPDELRLLLGPPTVALPSAMACHVFRSVIMGIIKDSTPRTTRFPSTIRYANGLGGTELGGNLGDTIILGDSTSSAGNVHLNITVSTETRMDGDEDDFQSVDRKKVAFGDDADKRV